MKKKIFKFLLIWSIIVPSLIISGCGKTGVPNEQTLKANGTSIIEALPNLKSLTDNYAYKHKIHQTNGEDWFSYENVKLYDGNILVRSLRINNNIGWQYEDEIFTNEEDLTDFSYDLYVKQIDNNFYKYSKFKYNTQDENFEKLYYTNQATYDINAYADNYKFQYSFIETNYFEYFLGADDNNNPLVYWKVNSATLSNHDFKQSVNDGFNLGCNLDNMRLDYFYVYVANNEVYKIEFGYLNNANNLYLILHNEITFDYDNYEFNSANLGSGFSLYE